MKWITKDESLPDWGQGVLIALNTGLITIGYRTKKNGSYDWQLFGDLDVSLVVSENDYVTHWMPLPPEPDASLPSSSVTGEVNVYAGALNTERIKAYRNISQEYNIQESTVRDIFCKGIDWYKKVSSLPVTGESEAIEVVDGYTLINLDKRTLPKDGQKVEFENDHEDTYEGYYIEKEGMFHVSDSVFFFSWHVHKWKAI